MDFVNIYIKYKLFNRSNSRFHNINYYFSFKSFINMLHITSIILFIMIVIKSRDKITTRTIVVIIAKIK